MQWGVSKIIFRILVLYVFNYQFANLEMTISCSFMKWCPVPLFLRMFVFYKFNYQFAYFQMTSPCSQMQWSGSNKMISRILILNVFDYQFANWGTNLYRNNVFKDFVKVWSKKVLCIISKKYISTYLVIYLSLFKIFWMLTYNTCKNVPSTTKNLLWFNMYIQTVSLYKIDTKKFAFQSIIPMCIESNCLFVRS